MLNVSIKGNGNTVNFPSQQPLDLEKRTNHQTVVLTDTELREMTAAARRLGYSKLSVFIREMAVKGMQFVQFENLTLAEIVTSKNFKTQGL